MKTRFLGGIIFLSCVLIVGANANASVVINEIMWDGLEYIELYNPTDTKTVLDGWQITAQREEGGAEKTVVVFGEKDVILSKGFYLSEKKGEATTLEGKKFNGDQKFLLNKGELLRLRDNNNVVVDIINQYGKWFAGTNIDDGISMERNESAVSGENITNWHTSTDSLGGRLGTPGALNSVVVLNKAPTAFIVAPKSAKTGEEISFSGDKSIDLDGDELSYAWDFGDGAFSKDEVSKHEYNQPGAYVVKLMVSDGSLNNEVEHRITVSLPTYYKDVVINEFLPNPIGSDNDKEFIEIKNIGKEKVNLKEWWIDDMEGGSSAHVFTEDLTLEEGAIVALRRDETGIALNNTGDAVRLFNPNGVVVSSFLYEKEVVEGVSYCRDNGSYSLSTTVTEGAENIITKPDDASNKKDVINKTKASSFPKVLSSKIKKVSLKNIRKEKLGTRVVVEGVVSAPFGVLGKRVMYLAGSGIQIYSSDTSSDFVLGDKVRVTGKLSVVSNESRIKVSGTDSLIKISSGDFPEPHQVSVGDIDENLEGSLITVRGKVIKTNGSVFYINDGTGEIKIYIKPSTGIDKPKMKKGMTVTISGIVSETLSGYRILPRFQEDVRVGVPYKLKIFPATGVFTEKIVAILVASYLLVTAINKKEPLITGVLKADT